MSARTPYQDTTVPVERSKEQIRAALKEAGVAVNEDFVVAVRWGIEGGSIGMSALLALPHTPTAVFAFSDEVAFGAMRTLRRAGLEVPYDMSLSGVDDHPMAESMDLTTVAQSPRRQGEIAAELCIGLLENEGPPLQVPLPSNLVIRRSVTPPRPGRRAVAALGAGEPADRDPEGRAG